MNNTDCIECMFRVVDEYGDWYCKIDCPWDWKTSKWEV